MTDESKDAALLTAIFDAAVDAIIVSDTEGRTTRANNAAARMFGYSEAELIGRNVAMLMPRAMAERHGNFMSDHLSTGEKRIIGIGREVEGLRKNGTVFPLHLSVGRTTVDGQVVFIAILHDLTLRKATEDALSRSQRLDAIGQMTGGIAHDFNNLLTVIIGNLELLEMHISGDKVKALLNSALEAAELGAQLTSQLLVFARNSMLTPEPSNLNEICAASLSILTRTLGALYRVETRFDKDIALVSVDASQLQTSIMNLALNAKDAMPEGGTLSFETQNIEIDDSYVAQEIDVAKGSYVRLTISDTGYGMTPEAQKRAFEPFFTTKPVGKGTGLGLSMVYGFIRQSKGHITLYSEPGLGTTIGLYFPALPTGGTAADTSLQSLQTLPLGKGQRVLVVEDNTKLRSLTVARLEALGYATQEAADGDDAWAMIQAQAPVDLLFSDLVMPGTITGYQLACRVRAEFPDMRILLTSGYFEDIVQPPPDEDTPFEIIRKPYRQLELAQRLQALFSEG